MAGNLILPRVRISWNGVNLSAYDGTGNFPKGQPIAYDTSVQLQSQSQAPTGSFSWDPTGPAFAIYESYLTNEAFMKARILIDFFYAGQKRIRFAFVWAGHSIDYGNDMSVEVKLKSELAGLIDATPRTAGQVYDEKTGDTYISALEKIRKQHLIEPANIVQFTDKAKEDLTKAKVLTNYGVDQTYGAAVANLVQQNGNVTFASNIEEPRIVVYTPYSWEKNTTILNGVTDIPPDTSPDPTKRYGYLLGPSMIKTMNRVSEWKPPQQTTQETPSTQIKPVSKTTKKDETQKPAPKPQNQVADSKKPSSAPIGPANNRSSPGVQSKDNEDGPEKQKILNEEGTADLSLQTLLVPALVGIKPHDIVYIPSLKGNYIEDWIVENVTYDQKNGDVSVNISAKRPLGLGTPMNEKSAEKFKFFAENLGLIGPNATLSNWDNYAWSATNQNRTPASEEQVFGRVTVLDVIPYSP